MDLVLPMTVAKPVLEIDTPARRPAGAAVARQLSVWPFAARTARLFLLLDPSIADEGLRRGVVRAMQQAYFAADCQSQTRAVRRATLAAHYVLRHRNRDVLPLDQVNAATAVAAVRGDMAYVALAGQAAAFAWRAGELTGQRGVLRLPRPLGLEHDPLITLWSTPLGMDDRLILVCGASWRRDATRTLHDILASTTTAAEAEEQLSDTLGRQRPAAVQVIAPADARRGRRLHLVGPAEPPPPAPKGSKSSHRRFGVRRLLTSAFGVALLASVIMAAFTFSPETPRTSNAAPQMMQLIGAPDRVDRVAPNMAVRLGPSAVNVVDLAVGAGALYTLDVGDGTVRAFALDALDQPPTPETLLARPGSPIANAGRRLDTPVAIEYVGGALLLVDQARTVVQVGQDRALTLRTVPSSAGWQALGALGSDSEGRLYFVDSAARRLLQYPPVAQRVLDPPQVVVDASMAPNLPFDRMAEVVPIDTGLVTLLEDGSLHLVGAAGVEERVPLPDVEARSITSDRAGGLYVADPSNGRILHVGPDGAVLRELRDPALGGVRQIQSSQDGQRVFGLVASGVLVFDTPPR